VDVRNWKSAVRRWSAALALVVMVAGGIGITAVVLSSTKAMSPPASQRAAPPPPPSVPTPQEFTVAVLVTEQNCPADSCVYKYTIDPKYIGTHPFPEKEFTVVYEVTGGHQPQVGQFTVHNGQAQITKDVILEGPPAAPLRAAVTQVIG